ncbi:MAG: SLBB domain-containing protein [Candidatus Sericytochromatia bacterium]
MKKPIYFLLMALLCWGWLAPAWGQNLQQELERAQPQLGFTRVPPEDQPARLPDEHYRLGPGDQLTLVIWNEHLNLTYELVVNPQGEILVPRLGLFSVSNQGVTQLEQAVLARAHALQREKLQVRVLLRQIRRVQVLVTGYVLKPGYYQIYWGTPLLDVLRRAGGIRDNGSVRQIRLSDAKGASRSIDLFRFHFDGKPEANPILSGGEQVFVPALSQRVAVLGEVQQPGIYEVLAGDTAADILKWAGGLKPTADPGGLQLWSAGLERSGAPALQPATVAAGLQSGDVLYAGPRKLELTEQKVLLQGQLRQPGPVTWRRGMTLLDAFEAAGGALPTADLGAVRISRQSDGQPRRELQIQLQAYLSGQNPEGNPELLPEDVITVPESFFNIRNITELTTLILSTLGIVSVVINLSRSGQ